MICRYDDMVRRINIVRRVRRNATPILVCALTVIFLESGARAEASTGRVTQRGGAIDFDPLCRRRGWSKPIAEHRDGYSVYLFQVRQPKKHRGGKGRFRSIGPEQAVNQQVRIVIPDGAKKDAKIFYELGGESAATEQRIVEKWQLHGKPRDVIYVQAEHRGYGASLSFDDDQTVPDYLNIAGALKDAHRIRRDLGGALRGDWIVYGASYPGSLAIDYAARYPNDVTSVIAESAIVDWQLQLFKYEDYFRQRVGDEAYRALVKHVQNRRPEQVHDKNWVDLFYLSALVVPLTQWEAYQSFVPQFRRVILDSKDTDQLVAAIKYIDQTKLGGFIKNALEARMTTALSREDALKRSATISYRTWLFQNASALGAFWSSKNPDEGLFPISMAMRRAESMTIFPGAHFPDWDNHFPAWNIRDRIAQLEKNGTPLIVIAGGQDPWSPYGLEKPSGDPDDHNESWDRYHLAHGSYYFVPLGLHGPSLSRPELAQAALFDAISNDDGSLSR